MALTLSKEVKAVTDCYVMLSQNGEFNSETSGPCTVDDLRMDDV